MRGNRRFLWLPLALAFALLLGVSPFAAPAPAAAVESYVSVLNWATNDLVYNPVAQRLFASVPGAAGVAGNSIIAIDPLTQLVDAPYYIGSEPYKLALADDGQYLYVALRGTAEVKRIRLADWTADLQFTVGNDPSYGPLQVDDMAVAPGNPAVVAISRRNTGYSPRHEGVAVYENGQQRPTTTADHTGSNVIAFTDSAASLYGYNNETSEFGFRRMAVDANGVAVVDVTPGLISGYNVDIVSEAGRIYSTTGKVLDPERRLLLGTYAGLGYARAVYADASVNRVYFLTGTSLSSHYQLQVFDLLQFTLLGTIDVTGVNGYNVSSLVRWGSDGLAFRSDGGQVFFMRSPLIAGELGPTPTPTQTPASTPTQTPAPTPTFTPTPSPTPVPSLHVFDLDGKTSVARGYWGATVTAAVHDGSDIPIAGATVIGKWSAGYAGNTWCTTGADGRCELSTGTVLKKQSSVTFTVDDVVYGAYRYEPAANHDADGGSNGTIVTVNKTR